MEESMVYHQTIGSKYKVQFERTATAKGVLGYKVEAVGDDLNSVMRNAAELKERAEAIAPTEVAP